MRARFWGIGSYQIVRSTMDYFLNKFDQSLRYFFIKLKPYFWVVFWQKLGLIFKLFQNDVSRLNLEPKYILGVNLV